MKAKNISHWLLAFGLTLALFYGIDHLVMSLQGLPLDFDLTPRQ